MYEFCVTQRSYYLLELAIFARNMKEEKKTNHTIGITETKKDVDCEKNGKQPTYAIKSCNTLR